MCGLEISLNGSSRLQSWYAIFRGQFNVLYTYLDLIQWKMGFPFIDNPGLESFFKGKSSQKVILQMSNSNWFIILS